jgi:hypothetical protein
MFLGSLPNRQAYPKYEEARWPALAHTLYVRRPQRKKYGGIPPDLLTGDVANLAGNVVRGLVSLSVIFCALKIALNKQYSGFQLRLVRETESKR